MTTPACAERETVIAARSPGWLARIVIAAALILAVLVWLAGSLDDKPFPLDDPAIRNLIMMSSCIAAALTSGIWFFFRSGHPPRLRMAVGTGAIVGAVIIASVLAGVRFTHRLQFSGSLVPGLKPPEHELPCLASNAIATQVELAITTADDFPQFLGPERCAWVQDPRLHCDWKTRPPRQLWKRPVGAGWSAFAAVNGFAMTQEQRGSEEWVVCYDVESGKPVWGHAVLARHETTLGGIGPRSTPTIHQGRVYVLGATGILRCLDSSGQLLWSDDLRERYEVSDNDDEQNVMFGRAASPLIVESVVIVPGGGPQGKAKNLVAFDLQTGRLVWEAENKLENDDADQISYASPSLATLAGRQQILIVNESTVSGHDPVTGKRLWSHSWPGRSNGNASISQALAVGDSRVLLTKAYGGGAELIELRAGPDDELTTSTVWKNPRVLQTKFSNVVVRYGHAFALSEGILECVDLETGRRRWKGGRYGHGQILGVGDLLLVLDEGGELHLVRLNPKKLVHLGSIQTLSGKTWNNLCLFGHRLLVRNAEEAACFELPVELY